MKVQVIVIFIILALVFVSGCVSENIPINGNGLNGLIQTCQPDYIVGGPLQKVGEMVTNFNVTCSNMCNDKYKITNYRIDQKTETFSMCYCDVNEC